MGFNMFLIAFDRFSMVFNKVRCEASSAVFQNREFAAAQSVVRSEGAPFSRIVENH